MTTILQDHVFAALRKILSPIIKILLRNGVSYKDFCSFSKNLFVAVAAAEFGLRGRPTNVSRIALLTGLDRKEVKRLKDLLPQGLPTDTLPPSQHRITRLLSAWHVDQEFLTESGLPNILPMDGAEGSFTSLVKRYGGDVPLPAVLKELLRSGAVKALAQSHFKVMQRYYFPAPTDPEAILRAGSVISELAETLVHNLYECPDNDQKTPRFERRASNHLVDPKHQKAFKAFVDKEGQAFLERVDDWLSAHEVTTHSTPTETPLYLGVGVYSIYKNNPEG